MFPIERGHSCLAFAAILLIHCTSSSDSNESSSQVFPVAANPHAAPVGIQTNVRADYHTRKTPPLAAGEVELITLSSLPDAVTGDDALLGLRGLDPAETYTVTRNGLDVTAAFQRKDSGEVRGLVTGLRRGGNTITATARGARGTRVAELTVNNHPITGPVLSGPHQAPFVCQTKESGLGDPLDADCSIDTQYEWDYRSTTDQQYRKLSDPYAEYPADVMQTVTSAGRPVPFVVRLESATINRGITRIAVLDDPHARGRGVPFDASGWNRRVHYSYGGSCSPGYHQGTSAPSEVLGGAGDLLNVVQRLAKGDVVVHSTLSTYGVDCNPLVSIETASMVKEHINEQYGLIDDMVSTGISGGAMQQYNAIDNAPGLLNASIPGASFPDLVSTLMTVADCALLTHYFGAGGSSLDQAKRAGVTGHNLETTTPTTDICVAWTFAPYLDPKKGCDPAVPQSMIYDPVSNPKGVRCAYQDGNVNLFGRDPKTGFARRPVDNTGVQYGLDALNHGVITADEFVNLNRDIGGLDIDNDFVSQRMRMDPEVEAISFRTGSVVGRGAIAETPVMDTSPYLDLNFPISIHESVRPFITRARILARTGRSVNQSIWRGIDLPGDSYSAMETWFPALRELPYGSDRAQALAAAKPADAADRCIFSATKGRLDLPQTLLAPPDFQGPLLPRLPPGLRDQPFTVNAPEDFAAGTGPCSTYLPVIRTPRMVAGMPLTDDVIRCPLKPVDRSDYQVSMTDAQLADLRGIFPDGVCDWKARAASSDVESLAWPSIGDEVQHEPKSLEYRVARSIQLP